METPVVLVRACLAMLPRLQAEESQLAATRTAMGTGTIEQHNARAIQRGWDQTAHPQRAKAVRVADPAVLADLGIGYHEVTRG